MSSRQNLLTAALGLVSGVVGAIVAAQVVARQAPPPRQPERPQPPVTVPLAPKVPPGWDPRIAEQLAALERRVGAAETALSKRADPEASGSASPSDDDAGGERLERYQQTLVDHARRIEEHQNEPVDAGWSKPLGESIQAELSQRSTQGAFQTKRVECRSRTCLATITFPSAAEAVRAQFKYTRYLPVQGCNGDSTVLTPPNGDGPYDLQVLYSCR